MKVTTTPLRIQLSPEKSISALLKVPDAVHACFVLAHGAGADMNHPLMADLATALAERGVATLRFQFPFMEQGSKRPDNPAAAQATVRSAVEEARSRLPGVPLFAGGKSFGGRMTTQAHADRALDGVQGLVLVGFPLHPAGKPDVTRAEHLTAAAGPMLFLQGTRDALADLPLIQEVTQRLGDKATLAVIDGADHSFHVLVRSGKTDAQVVQEIADITARWMKQL